MKYLNLLFAFLVSISLWACGDGDEPAGDPKATITVNPASLAFPTVGGQATVAVTCTKGWSAFSDDEWLTVGQNTSAAGEGVVTVKAQENLDFEARTGTVTIKSGTERKTVSVTQEAADRPAPGDITCPIEGYRLVWHDEFDEGSRLGADWIHEVKADHWVNNELQNYVDGASPKGTRVTEIKDGALHINCFKEDGKVCSGRVYAKKSKGWKYGYIEASIWLPKGKGTWPAFWMMPVNFRSWPTDGEIDIMEEVGANANYVSSSLHADGHVHTNGTQITHEMLCKGAEDGYHVYAMEWTADCITTYVDGKQQLKYKNPGTGNRDWPYDAPFYVILNLAWGGDWGGYKGIDESALPTTMKIDYVRVFQK